MKKYQKIPDYDSLDPTKRAVGKKLQEMASEDKKDRGTRLIEFFIQSKLSEEEIIDIQYDPCYWIRDNQFCRLGWKDPRIVMFLAGRGLC